MYYNKTNLFMSQFYLRMNIQIPPVQASAKKLQIITALFYFVVIWCIILISLQIENVWRRVPT